MIRTAQEFSVRLYSAAHFLLASSSMNVVSGSGSRLSPTNRRGSSIVNSAVTVKLLTALRIWSMEFDKSVLVGEVLQQRFCVNVA
jgi:hypothetical protein